MNKSTPHPIFGFSLALTCLGALLMMSPHFVHDLFGGTLNVKLPLAMLTTTVVIGCALLFARGKPAWARRALQIVLGLFQIGFVILIVLVSLDFKDRDLLEVLFDLWLIACMAIPGCGALLYLRKPSSWQTIFSRTLALTFLFVFLALLTDFFDHPRLDSYFWASICATGITLSVVFCALRISNTAERFRHPLLISLSVFTLWLLYLLIVDDNSNEQPLFLVGAGFFIFSPLGGAFAAILHIRPQLSE